MAKYLVLYKFTDQGARSIDTLPQRAQAARQNAEQHGVKVLSWYLTLGRYDVATVVEADDEQTVVSGLLAVARGGNVRTETLRAFDENEMQQIVQKIGQ